jgi:uncharacterized protein DUF1707
MSEIEKAGSGQLRIGYAEREKAAADLGEHLAAGRLDPDEYTERVGRVYAARTAGELTPLFRDLPSLQPVREPRPVRQAPGFPVRMVLIVALILACVAWVAFVRIPPFFVFPLFWLVFARQRAAHGHRGHW